MSVLPPPTSSVLPGLAHVSVHRIGADSGSFARPVVDETPIEIVYNGDAYAVMMATPGDLDDFVTGFTLSEQLIDGVAAIRSLTLSETPLGWRADVALAESSVSPGRRRQRIGDSGCGLCGVGGLAQVAQPLQPISRRLPPVPESVLFQALSNLEAHQPLNHACGGAHAAAAVDSSGNLCLVREDVGRHNAFDKLIGAAARAALDLRAGFVLLSSRCSYELVEKAIVAGVPMLVTISAPTSLAVRRAVAHDLTLVSLARRDSMLVIHDPYGTIVLDTVSPPLPVQGVATMPTL